MNSDPYLAIFGLLCRSLVVPAEGPVLKEYDLDSFRVVEQAAVSTLHCKCRRSEPLILATADIAKVHPVQGLFACQTCLDELRSARTVAQRVNAWVLQNKANFTFREHLYMPNNLTRFMDPDSKLAIRPRRYIYSSFYGLVLGSKEHVVSTCSDAHCVNPLHCQIATSPAAKVTANMVKDTSEWLQKGISSRTLQELIEVKYGVLLSMRTIDNLKKSASLLQKTQTYCVC